MLSLRRPCVLLFALATLLAPGCAGSRLEPTIVSSADETGYAVRYPQTLERASAAFEADLKRAYELSAGLDARAAELSTASEPELLRRVVDEADAAGRSQTFAQASEHDRALRAFFDEERGAISARVSSATQKQLSEAECTKEVDTQGAVSAALRDAVERQLERRLRAENEAQRTLELHKARLPPAKLSALQRWADEIALASQLVHVTLVHDVKELDRVLGERARADAALERAIDDERAIQAEPRRASEQRASQARVREIEQSRVAIAPSSERAEQLLRSYEEQLARARDDYARALSAIRARLSAPAAQSAPSAQSAPAPPAAK